MHLWRTSLSAVLVAALPTVVGADDLAQELRSLRQEIDQQRQVINQLRGELGDQWLNQRRAEEVKALVREVLADADTHASLADNALTAGRDKKGFFIGDAEGNFRLGISGQVQVRYIANFRDAAGAPTSPDDDAETGFQIRRARFVFDGFVSSPRLTYQLQITANRDTSALELERAFIGYKINDAFTVGGGRFKDNFLREETISDSRQLAVERTLVNQIFSQNYVEGVYATWQPCQEAKLFASITDGQRSGDPGGSSTGFQNGGNDFNNDASDLALTARADVKLAGDWAQANDFNSWSGEPLAVFLGGGAHYEIAESGDSQVSGTTTATGAYDSFLSWTVDGSIEYLGANFYAAYVGQFLDAAVGNARGDQTSHAFLAQAGYMIIPDKLEPFVRYEWISIDNAVAVNDVNIFTAGLNYYLNKHAAKVTMDVVWVMQPLSSGNTQGFSGSTGTGLTGLGLLGDAASAEDQVSLRVQFQLLF